MEAVGNLQRKLEEVELAAKDAVPGTCSSCGMLRHLLTDRKADSSKQHRRVHALTWTQLDTIDTQMLPPCSSIETCSLKAVLQVALCVHNCLAYFPSNYYGVKVKTFHHILMREEKFLLVIC